jgi:hypothetical protein
VGARDRRPGRAPAQQRAGGNGERAVGLRGAGEGRHGQHREDVQHKVMREGVEAGLHRLKH